MNHKACGRLSGTLKHPAEVAPGEGYRVNTPDTAPQTKTEGIDGVLLPAALKAPSTHGADLEQRTAKAHGQRGGEWKTPEGSC